MKLRILSREREAEGVESFSLASPDGCPLAPFLPGQHVSLRIGEQNWSYSLSDAPSPGAYRITVKHRRGPAGTPCRWSDTVAVGDVVEVGSPSGGLHVGLAGDAPLVLVSAGIGIAPMVSIIKYLAIRGDARPVWFLHGNRCGSRHAHKLEVAHAASSITATIVTAYSRPDGNDRPGRDFQIYGRLDAAQVLPIVPDVGQCFFLCGPPEFELQWRSELSWRAIPPERVCSSRHLFLSASAFI